MFKSTPNCGRNPEVLSSRLDCAEGAVQLLGDLGVGCRSEQPVFFWLPTTPGRGVVQTKLDSPYAHGGKGAAEPLGELTVGEGSQKSVLISGPTPIVWVLVGNTQPSVAAR